MPASQGSDPRPENNGFCRISLHRFFKGICNTLFCGLFPAVQVPLKPSAAGFGFQLAQLIRGLFLPSNLSTHELFIQFVELFKLLFLVKTEFTVIPFNALKHLIVLTGQSVCILVAFFSFLSQFIPLVFDYFRVACPVARLVLFLSPRPVDHIASAANQNTAGNHPCQRRALAIPGFIFCGSFPFVMPEIDILSSGAHATHADTGIYGYFIAFLAAVRSLRRHLDIHFWVVSVFSCSPAGWSIKPNR
ncbi:hypothetical protein D3C81_1026390 [compost metagenome]